MQSISAAGGRLRIRREIADDVRGALTPPMLVQGLVENALKHGISRSPEGGELELRVTREGDMLRLEAGNTVGLREPREMALGSGMFASD